MPAPHAAAPDALRAIGVEVGDAPPLVAARRARTASLERWARRTRYAAGRHANTAREKSDRRRSSRSRASRMTSECGAPPAAGATRGPSEGRLCVVMYGFQLALTYRRRALSTTIAFTASRSNDSPTPVFTIAREEIAA